MTSDPNASLQIPQGFQFTAPNLGRLPPQTELRTRGTTPVTRPDPPPTPHYQVIQLPTKPGQPRLWYWYVEVNDGSMGIHQRGKFPDIHASRSQSTLDSRYRGHEHLSFLNETQVLDPGGSTVKLISSLDAFGTTLIAPYIDSGSGNFTPLFKETSVTDPTLVQLTFSRSVSHAIKGLANLVVNGAPVVALLKDSQPPELLSDLVTGGPTSVGNMHTDLQGCFAATMTTLPDTALLFLVGNTVKALGLTDAFGTQPTTVGNLPRGGGGFSMGLQSLSGSEIVWLVNSLSPDMSTGFNRPNGFPAFAGGEPQYPGTVYKISLNGQDVDPIPLPVKYVEQSGIVRDGFWFDDGLRVGFYNGRPLDTRIFRDPVINSDNMPYRIVGCHVVNNSDLYADVLQYISTPKLTRLYYNWNDDEWVNVASSLQVSGGFLTCQATGNLPTSNQTGYLHQLNHGLSARTWERQWQPPASSNPYSFRQTLGAGATTGRKFATGGLSYLPDFDIPGLEGKVKTLHRMYEGGEITQNDGTTVQIQAGGTGPNGQTQYPFDETFSAITFNDAATPYDGVSAASRWRTRNRHFDRFIRLSAITNVTQGSNAYMTPQVLPWSLEGLAYEDEASFNAWASPGRVTWS